VQRRQLILMRHASAAVGDGHDHARELTESGWQEALLAGRWLASMGWAPDRVFCSSARRCRDTWQALSAGLGREGISQFEDDLYNASPVALLDALLDFSATLDLAEEAQKEILLLIAHNPGISQLAADLAGKSTDPARLHAGFAPATLACFDVPCPWPLLARGAARLIHFQHVADFSVLESETDR
jgi:phosphohistidine phosphatase